MKQFGVGCLHFSIGNKLNKNITAADYSNEIIKSLEKLTTVSNIEISIDEDYRNTELKFNHKTIMKNGEPCFPHLFDFSLTFNIYIPKRVQALSINEKEDFVRTYTENFKVTFYHSWYGPVTFIECLDASYESSPSNAVRIIREYLSKEFSNLDTYLFLDFVGPSPFHADFSLIDNVDPIEGENNFILEHIELEGYDKLIFKYFNDDSETENQILDYLYFSLSDELAYYYYIKTNRSSEINSWSEIQKTMHTLLDFEDEASQRSIKEKLFEKPKIYKKAFKEIGIFRGELIQTKSTIDQYFRDIYSNKKQSVYLKNLVEKPITEWQIYPVQETIDLLLYFDKKNSKSLELSVVFTAAVVGGAIGGAISVLFSN